MICKSVLIVLFYPLLLSTEVKSQCLSGTVNLVSGLGPHEGRVEICVNGVWGTVCDDSWSTNDAIVVCRQLGYSTIGATALSNALFGQGTGSIFMDDVACGGTEERLKSCTHTSSHNCGHSEDASVRCRCAEGSVGLVGGNGPHEGRVHVCINGIWGTVCDVGWSVYDARVVCRQLGYPATGASALSNAYFGAGTGSILMNQVGCYSSGTALTACPHTRSFTCNHRDDASVRCGCTNGDVSLFGGGGAHEGRVHVCLNRVWGTICDSGWSSNDARVVCRQLAYSTTGAVALLNAYFGPGNGSVLMTNVGCRSTETRLSSCTYTSIVRCGHYDDASVRCGSRCTSGDVAVVVGTNGLHEGRVQVCSGGSWGTVCDDSWSLNDAIVTCRQMGYITTGATALSNAFFGSGSGSIVMDDVACTGSEPRLISCTHTSIDNCDHTEDASVRCSRTRSSPSTGVCYRTFSYIEYRRISSTSSYLHSYDCGLFDWSRCYRRVYTYTSSLQSHIVYRAVPTCCDGYTGDGQTCTPLCVSGCRNGRCSSPGICTCYTGWTGSTCNQATCSRCVNGRCSRPNVCSCYSGWGGVACDAQTCTGREGSIRLAGGTSLSGRVELCVGGVWGTVCDDLWDNSDASVACYQLGLSRYNAQASTFRTPGTGPIHMDNVACTGRENSLSACRHITNHNCVHSEDAGVTCRRPTCRDGSVRLVHSRGIILGSTRRGRVEICYNETWSTICDQNWGVADAQVVCAQLGYLRSGARSHTDALFGQGTGPVILSNVRCSGSETSLLNCSRNSFGVVGSCTHADDVGVTCRTSFCTNGDLYLVGGVSENEGRLELCHSNSWGTVCDDYWNSSATVVACRQLGIRNSQHVARLGNTAFGVAASTVSILLDDVRCSGTESSLLRCSHLPVGQDNCGHYEDITLRCGVCEEGAVRLVDGRTHNEGRVEVCLGGAWGTICDDGWSVFDARVTCRQLGYPATGAAAISGTSFTPNYSLPIVMDNVVCLSTERRLIDCGHRNAHNLRHCSHIEDARLRCTTGPPGPPQSLRVTRTLTNSLTLVWSRPAPSTPPSAATTAYSIICSASGRTTRRARTTTLSATVSSLTPSTSYNCCVAADSSRGLSTYLCVIATTLTDTPSGPPRSVVGSPASSRSLTLSWRAPSQPNGNIRYYAINITELATNSMTRYTTSSLRRTVTGLHPYYYYSIRIAAVTVREGPYSSAIRIRTYTDTPSGTPTLLGSSAITATSVRLTWQQPLQANRNGIILSYRLRLENRRTFTSSTVTVQPSSVPYTSRNLSPYTTYRWSVAAATVNGTGPYTSRYSFVTLSAAPSAAPRSVRHSNVRKTSFLIRWSAPSTNSQNGVITSYYIELNDTVGVRTVSRTTYSYTINNLQPYTVYGYRVAAFTVGRGPYSPWQSVTTLTDIPSASPTNVRVQQKTRTSITIVWGPPSLEDQNGLISSYTVHITPQGGSAYTRVTTATSYVDSSLLSNTEYSFAVAASTSAGRGPYSSPSLRATTLPPVSTSAPGNVTLTVLDHERILVTWTAPPPSQQSGTIDGYQIRVTEVGTGRSWSERTSAVLHYTLNNLRASTTYRVQVKALPTVGSGVYSAVLSNTTTVIPPGGSPNITAYNSTSRSVFLQWIPPPTNQQHGTITGYIIDYLEDGLRRRISVGASVRQYTIMASPYTEYVLGVAALNSAGTGPVSTRVELHTAEEAPSHHPLRLMGVPLSSTSISLTWDPPPEEHRHGVIDSYTVLCTLFNHPDSLSRYETPATNLTVTGLLPYRTYSCNVSAYTIDHGPFSDTILTTTREDIPSGVPTGLSAGRVEPDSISLTWTPPDPGQRNGMIRHYLIKLSIVGSLSTVTHVRTSTSGTSYQVTGLRPYTVYSISVAAVTVGTGPSSSSINITTNEAPPSAPPTSLSINVTSPQSLVVSWDPPPLEDRNGIIRYYIIRIRGEEEDTSLREINTQSSTTRFTVEDLHPYYNYNVSVAAGTTATGPFTPTVRVQIPETAPSSAPRAVRGRPLSSRSINLQWQPPSFEHQNGRIVSYEIQCDIVDTSTDQLLTLTSITTEKTINGLHPYYTYQCSVSAVTVAAGPFSTSVNITTHQDIPSSTPLGLQIQSYGSRNVTLTWTHPLPPDRNGVIRHYSIFVIPTQPWLEANKYMTMSAMLSYTISDLHPHSRYTFSVAAVTVGPGPNATLSLRTEQEAPSSPPDAVSVISLSPYSIQISWRPPPNETQNGDIVSYTVSIGTGAENATLWTVSNGLQLIVDSLHPHYEYQVSVSATTVAEGPFSTEESITMPEAPPSAAPSVSVGEVSSHSIQIQWIPLDTLNQNGIITNYTVLYWTNRGINSSIKVDSTEFTKLVDPFTMYWFRVAAETSAGLGPFSEVLSVESLQDAPSRSPMSLEVVSYTSTTIELNWEAPPSQHHNGIIRSYIVHCYERETEDIIRTNSSTTDIVVDDLHPFYTYNCSIAATTIIGPGPFTLPILITTLQDAPSGRPYNLTETSVTTTSLEISWTPPDPSRQNGIIQYYIVYVQQVEPETTSDSTTIYNSSSTSLSLTGLTPYTSHQVKVTAVTIAPGPNSTVELFRTEEDVPSAAPLSVTAYPISSVDLSVTWRAPLQEQRNGKIRYYSVSVYEVSTEETTVYRTTDNTAHWSVAFLLPYSVYLVRVAAVTIGIGPFSEAVEVRMFEDAPSRAPTNISVVEKGSSYALLQWLPPPEPSHNGIIRHYIVALIDGNSSDSESVGNYTSSSSQPHINIVSLLPGHTYLCTVAAVTISIGPYSLPVSFTTEPGTPGTVDSLIAIAISSRSMNISWAPPDDISTVKEIIEYQLTITHFGDPSDQGQVIVTDFKSIVLGSLHPNYVYQCSVTFRTSTGYGPVASVLIKLPPDLPSSSPQNVTAISSNPTTLHIYWTPPPLDQQNGDITQYSLNITEVEVGQTTQYYIRGTRTSFVLENLQPHYVYQYRMTAFTAVGHGPYSPSSTIQMPSAAPSSAPYNLSLDEVGSSYALLRWSPPPQSDHNGIINHYQVHRISSEGEVLINTEGGVTHLLLNALQPNTLYTCSVSAVTVSSGPLSSSINFTTNASAPNTVQLLRAAVTSPRTVNVTWRPPSNQEIYLDYQISLTPLLGNGQSQHRTISATAVVFTGLQPGTFYLCVVAARTSIGLQHSVNVILIEMPADAPTGGPQGISHAASNSRTLRLFWSPPPLHQQNGVIVHYSIFITEIETGTLRQFMTRDSRPTFTIPNLHPHYHYNYTITAATSAGSGPHSSSIHVQMPQDVPDGTPKSVTVINGGGLNVDLDWSPPSFDKRNGDITGYIVRIYGVKDEAVGNVTSHTVEGLNSSSHYSFSVSAKTSVGAGPFSDPVSLVTLHGESPAPEGVVAERVSATQISVQWPESEKDSFNTPIRSYIVKHYQFSSETRSRRDIDFELTETETNLTINGLVPTSMYAVAVAIKTDYGTGQFSDVIIVGLSENSRFQLFFIGAINCQQWILYHTDTKMESVRTSLAPELEKECQCQFSADYLKLGELQCISAHTDWLILWGRIIGTNHTNSTGIRNKLQIWSQQESMVVVEGVHLKTLKFCSVSLKEGEPPYCVFPQEPGSEEISSKVDGLNPTITYSIVSVVVLLLMMILAVVVCIATISCYRKKKVRDRQIRFHSNHPLTNIPPEPSTAAAKVKALDDGDSSSNIYEQADSIYETILDSESPYSQLPSQPPPLPDSNIPTKSIAPPSNPAPKPPTFPPTTDDTNTYSKTLHPSDNIRSKRCPSPVNYSMLNPIGGQFDGGEYASVGETHRKPTQLDNTDEYMAMCDETEENYDYASTSVPISPYQNVLSRSVDGNGYQVPKSFKQFQAEEEKKSPPHYANFVPGMKDRDDN